MTDEKLNNLTLTRLNTVNTDHREALLCCSFIDGQIAVGSKDSNISIYDSQGRKVKSLRGHDASVCVMRTIKARTG